MQNIIRSLEDKLGRVELVQDEQDFFWIQEGQRVSRKEQEALFKKYNPNLSNCLRQLRDYDSQGIRQFQLARILQTEPNSLRAYLLAHRPELYPGKLKPIQIECAYILLGDFMPIIEEWKTAKQVADALDISTSVVTRYCRRRDIEARRIKKRQRISSLGVKQLRGVLGITHPSIRAWKNTNYAARRLDSPRCTITLHCQRGTIRAEKYKGKWMIPEEEINKLRNILEKREPYFDFCRKTYYSVSSIAKYASEKRGITDPRKIWLLEQRIRHLIQFYPEVVPCLLKNNTHYVDEHTRDFLSDLLRQGEAVRLLGTDWKEFIRYMRNGLLDKVQIGPTRWTTYSSVMSLKAQRDRDRPQLNQAQPEQGSPESGKP